MGNIVLGGYIANPSCSYEYEVNSKNQPLGLDYKTCPLSMCRMNKIRPLS